jgi:predicted anti-sigma-YlaC factor YlaD
MSTACSEFEAILDAYFDDGTDRSAADSHVAGCAACRERLAAVHELLHDLPCSEFVELVTDYLEDAVDARERQRIDDHLHLCEGCRTYLDHMRQTIQTLGRLASREDNSGTRLALQAMFRTWRRHGTAGTDGSVPN